MAPSPETPQMEGTVYDDRLLYFIDILGWGDLLKSSEVDPSLLEPIVDAIKRLRMLADVAGMFEKDSTEHAPMYREFRADHFSDTLVVSVPSSNGPLVATATLAVRAAALALLRHGNYTRGAVVRGRLHHRDHNIFGPALVEAYNIERDVAVYPRIIIAPSAADLMLSQSRKPFMKTAIATDQDGMKRLEILNFGDLKTEQSDASAIKKQIEGKIAADSGKLKLLAKHQWMLNCVESWQKTIRNRPNRPPKSSLEDGT